MGNLMERTFEMQSGGNLRLKVKENTKCVTLFADVEGEEDVEMWDMTVEELEEFVDGAEDEGEEYVDLCTSHMGYTFDINVEELKEFIKDIE